MAAGDRAAAWRLASAITNWVVLITASLAVLAFLLAPWLVRAVIAPGFAPAQQAATAGVMRLVLISTVIFAISVVQGSVLNGFKHFLLPGVGAGRLSAGGDRRRTVAGAALGRGRAGGRRGAGIGAAPGDPGSGLDPLRFPLAAAPRRL